MTSRTAPRRLVHRKLDHSSNLAVSVIFNGGLSSDKNVRGVGIGRKNTPQGSVLYAILQGIWQELLAALGACKEPPDLEMVDSTAVRASLGRGCKRGQQNQAIGRSRGGPTTKLHALADGAGRLYALMLTAGQVHDIHGGRTLLANVAPMRRLIADKAYDFLASQGIEPVISPNPQRLAGGGRLVTHQSGLVWNDRDRRAELGWVAAVG